MPPLSEIMKDPNYVNANAATKKAIFEKWAPQDPNYSGANGATQAAIRAKAGVDAPQTRAEAKEAGVPRKERTWGEIGSMGARIIGDIAGETADFADQINPIARVTNWAARKLGGTDKTNAEVATRLADKVGLAAPEDDDERLKYETAKGVIGAAIPLPGAGKIKAGAMALDAVGGAIAGGGAEYARQQGAPGWLQTAIGLAGGVAPAAAATGVRHTVGTAKEFLDKGGTRAARRLQRRANEGGSAEAAARAINEAAEASPGTVPTMAEQAQNRGLAALQRESASNAIEEQVANNARQRVANVSETGGAGAPEAVQDLAVGRARAGESELDFRTRSAEQERARLQAQGERDMAQRLGENEAKRLDLENAQEAERVRIQEEGLGQLEGATEKVGPYRSPESSAAPLRKDLTERIQASLANVSKLYNARPLRNPSQVRIKAPDREALYDGILDRVNEHYGNLGGQPPKEASLAVREIFEEIQGKNLNTSMVANIDRRLADIAGTKRVAGAAGDASFVEKLRREFSSATDPYISARTKKALETAKASRREHAELFEQELGAPFEKDRFGSDTVKDPELSGRVILPGDPGATMGQQLIKALGVEKATDYVRQHFRRLAEDGLLDTRAQVRKYNPILNQFGDVKADVLRIRATREGTKAAEAEAKVSGRKAISEQRIQSKLSEESQRQTTAEALAKQQQRSEKYIKEQEALNKTFASDPLGKFANTKFGPHAHIADLLNAKDGKQMDDLHELIKDNPEAMDGVRRVLADHMAGAGPKKKVYGPDNKPIPNTADTLAEIDKVLTRGGKFLTDDQHTALTALQKEMQSAEFAKTGGVRAVEEDISHEIAPTKTAWAARMIRFALKHATNQGKVDELIQSAIRNPKEASKLLLRPTLQRKKMIMNTLRRGAIAGGRGAGQPQEPNAYQEY